MPVCLVDGAALRDCASRCPAYTPVETDPLDAGAGLVSARAALAWCVDLETGSPAWVCASCQAEGGVWQRVASAPEPAPADACIRCATTRRELAPARARFVVSSAVVTAPGDYRYRLLSPDEARAWWLSAPVVSRIGCGETCTAIGRVLDVPAPAVDRRTVRMEVGDEALVFHVALPPHARRLAVEVKGREGVERLMAECEVGLLWRLR